MSRPTLTVELAGHGSLISGYRAWELIESVTGRRGCYIPTLRGFSVQESTARDIIAAAELRGMDVVVTGARAARKAQLWATLQAAPPVEQPDPGRGLW